MNLYYRWYKSKLMESLTKNYVQIVFGARQTGKSTLINNILPKDSIIINLADPVLRNRYLMNLREFQEMCLALPKETFVFIDEAQTVPEIFDSVQYLYDQDKARWHFILCGSSARKLRKLGANLLPGRSFLHKIYPLITTEQPSSYNQQYSPLVIPAVKDKDNLPKFPVWSLEERMTYGALPGIVLADKNSRGNLLEAYVSIHLEEEIRRESLVKDWGIFLHFLQFAAMESGKLLNYASISQEIGISIPTIKSYYQLLEDMFIGFLVPAFTKSKRKNILSTPRFFFFDLGVRHAAARLDIAKATVLTDPGNCFEQYVGIELWKRIKYLGKGSLYYQRSRDGAEVDFIIEHANKLIPLEVKWTENPNLGDAKHLLKFLEENPEKAKKGFIVCRCKTPRQIHQKIVAIPWDYL